MKVRVGWLVAAAIIVGVVVVIWVSAYRLRPQTPNAQKTQPIQKAATDTDELKISFEDLYLSDYDKDGNLRWAFKSQGSLDFDRHTMVATGSDITWELVRSQGARLSLTAAGFTGDYDEGVLKFHSGVQAQSSTEKFQFVADTVRYDMEQERLQAEGSVNATSGEYTVKAGEIAFRRLANTARAQHDVIVTSGDWRATAQAAELQVGAKTATLTGRPHIRTRDLTCTARKIVIDQPGQTAHLTGNVRAETGKIQARADSAVVKHGGRRAELVGSVTLKQGQMNATGPRLDIDVNNTTATWPNGGKLRFPFRHGRG